MTDKGETISHEGENEEVVVLSCPCFYEGKKNCPVDRRDLYTEHHIIEDNKETYELSLKDIHVWHGKLALVKPKKMVFDNKEPFVQMIFSIKCNGSISADFHDVMQLASYQHNLILMPVQTIQMEWQPESLMEMVVINITADFFFRYLPESLVSFDTFQNKYRSNELALLSKQNLSIKPRIMNILYDIIHCEHKGCYKKLFIESRVIELLTIQLEQKEHAVDNTLATQELKPDEIEKMHLAKEIIINNLANPLSLSMLAKQIGTNVFNLKKHFKQIFGTTVFGFIHAYRMEQSKEMLKKGELKISEIAIAAGYKHATHFTLAFKKYFGYLPNKVRG